MLEFTPIDKEEYGETSVRLDGMKDYVMSKVPGAFDGSDITKEIVSKVSDTIFKFVASWMCYHCIFNKAAAFELSNYIFEHDKLFESLR